MRFWQKTYILTLILFLVCLNAGILSLTLFTYSKSVRSAEESAGAEQYYIARSFERDLEDMLAASRVQSPSLLMTSYGSYYSEKGVFLAFESEGKTVYSNLPEMIEAETETLFHKKIGGVRHIVICSDVSGYTMIFAKNVDSLDREFRALTLTYMLTALGVSALLAAVLYFILKSLSLPLERLRETTEKIQEGDLSVSADRAARTNSRSSARALIRCSGLSKVRCPRLRLTPKRSKCSSIIWRTSCEPR